MKTNDILNLLIMRHASGVLSHVQTGFGYFEHERLPGRERKR